MFTSTIKFEIVFKFRPFLYFYLPCCKFLNCICALLFRKPQATFQFLQNGFDQSPCVLASTSGSRSHSWNTSSVSSNLLGFVLFVFALWRSTLECISLIYWMARWTLQNIFLRISRNGWVVLQWPVRRSRKIYIFDFLCLDKIQFYLLIYLYFIVHPQSRPQTLKSW